MFRNLRAVAQAAGGELDDVVKLTILMADLADFGKVNEIMATYFTAPYPARATYQVAALPKAAKLEVEGILVLAVLSACWGRLSADTPQRARDLSRAAPAHRRP